MFRALFMFIICGLLNVPATEYFVAPSGNNANTGTHSSTPFKTINKACSVVLAGDTIWLADGIYNENVTLNRSGTAAHYIYVKAINKWGPKIVGSGGSNGFHIAGNYIELDGIDLKNPGGHGFNCEGSHHIRIFNCHAHHCGNSGITGAWSDFYHFEGNVCNNNASLSWYSGISIYEAKSIGDNSAGYHVIIRNNICYDNFTYGGSHTDGNGIIIDDWNYTQNPGSPYPFEALVENNVCYNNGGSGIKTVWSDNITVRNNTCFNNNLDLNNDGTYRGEFYCQDSRNNKFINNIAITNPNVHRNNSAGMDKGNASGNVTAKNVWANNIFFNGTVGQSAMDMGNGSSPTLINNQNGVDPKFVNPNADDFHVQSTSPAIDAATTAYGYNMHDVDGVLRPQGAGLDIGAYEYRVINALVRRITIRCSRANYLWDCNVTASAVDTIANSKTVFHGVNPSLNALIIPVQSSSN